MHRTTLYDGIVLYYTMLLFSQKPIIELNNPFGVSHDGKGVGKNQLE